MSAERGRAPDEHGHVQCADGTVKHHYREIVEDYHAWPENIDHELHTSLRI